MLKGRKKLMLKEITESKLLRNMEYMDNNGIFRERKRKTSLVHVITTK